MKTSQKLLHLVVASYPVQSPLKDFHLQYEEPQVEKRTSQYPLWKPILHSHLSFSLNKVILAISMSLLNSLQSVVIALSLPIHHIHSLSLPANHVNPSHVDFLSLVSLCLVHWICREMIDDESEE